MADGHPRTCGALHRSTAGRLCSVLIAVACHREQLHVLTAADMTEQYRQAAESARSSTSCGGDLDFLRQQLARPDLTPDMRADLLHRLADRYVDEGVVQHLLDVAEAGSAPWTPYLEKAAKLYAILEAEYPTYPQLDEVTWERGDALERLGRPDEARVEYTTLLARWPTSPWAPKATARLTPTEAPGYAAP